MDFPVHQSLSLDFLRAALIYADPWGIVIPGLMVGLLFLLSHSGAVRHTEETTALAMAIVLIRRGILILFVTLPMIASIGLVVMARYNLGSEGSDAYIDLLTDHLIAALKALWWALALLIVLPSACRVAWMRWARPELSAWWRQMRVRQSGDALSDIRTEVSALSAMTFNPRDYYAEGKMFLGLDEDGIPVYLPDEVFQKNHLKVVGPTQVGKGVLLGVLQDQVIMKGWGLWTDDRKPDDFWLDIIQESCERWNRPPPLILDLNGIGPGMYGPFIAGALRDRRERVVKAFSLADTGSTGDYYKKNERAVLDFIMPFWDGSLAHLDMILSGHEPNVPVEKMKWIKETSDHLRANLSEFAQLETLMATAESSFNVEAALRSGAVVYVRSSLEDTVVKKAFMALLDEVVQCTRREPLPVHTFLALDEVRFSASNMLANALATVLSKRLNMALGYQGRNDLLNLEDRSVNAPAVQTGIENNTQVTISYRANGMETAEWISEMTGTVQKTVARMERVEMNHAGAEEWSGERTMAQVEETYISPNRLLALPSRIAVLIQPNELAKTIFTCWIGVERKRGMPPRIAGASSIPAGAQAGAASMGGPQPPSTQTPSAASPAPQVLQAVTAQTTQSSVPSEKADTTEPAATSAPAIPTLLSTGPSPAKASKPAPLTADEDAALMAALAAITNPAAAKAPAPAPTKPPKGVVSDIDDIEGL